MNAGLISIDPEQKWIGGRYYLQHLVRAVAALPPAERLPLHDVWWEHAPADDPFDEVRHLLAGSRTLRLPKNPVSRLVRRVRRAAHGWHDARDLFIDAGIDVLFPISPCADPGIPLVFWIPDLQYRLLPEMFGQEIAGRYERHTVDNGQAAARIVVSSAQGLSDLQHFFPEFAAKAHVLRFCSIPTREWWTLDPAVVARKHQLPERFFVLSNQFSHHKNHMTVIEGVRILRERFGTDVTVACTGSTYGFRGDDYMERIDSYLEDHRLRDAIRILGLIPRAEQIALVRRSVCMLQPSRFEGWSTVVEDARTLGKPILLSDIPVHREQAPPLVTYLPVDDPDRWAEAMMEQWSTGSPGPDTALERAGSERLVQAELETGRAFVRVLREAAESR